ncbi:hypothetical protein SDJN02_22816, partial [Cucurbita argyrosperma subsp. argyrosperma]
MIFLILANGSECGPVFQYVTPEYAPACLIRIFPSASAFDRKPGLPAPIKFIKVAIAITNRGSGFERVRVAAAKERRLDSNNFSNSSRSLSDSFFADITLLSSSFLSQRKRSAHAVSLIAPEVDTAPVYRKDHGFPVSISHNQAQAALFVLLARPYLSYAARFHRRVPSLFAPVHMLFYHSFDPSQDLQVLLAHHPLLQPSWPLIFHSSSAPASPRDLVPLKST